MADNGRTLTIDASIATGGFSRLLTPNLLVSTRCLPLFSPPEAQYGISAEHSSEVRKVGNTGFRAQHAECQFDEPIQRHEKPGGHWDRRE